MTGPIGPREKYNRRPVPDRYDWKWLSDELGNIQRGVVPSFAPLDGEVGPIDTRFPVANVRRYGAVGNAVHDDTAAIQRALDSAAANGEVGGRIYFPAGNYLVTDTLLISAHRQHLYGDGKWATTITFTPSSAKACLKFQGVNTAASINQCSLSDLSFDGGAPTIQKVAVDLWDTSEFSLSDVLIANWTGNSGSSSTPSIGLRTHGRDLTSLRRLDIYADRPIHVVKNPNAPSLSGDQFHGADLYLGALAAGEYCIVIDGDATVSNFTLDGYQSWVLGLGGIWAKPGGSSGISLNVRLSNIRYEQPTTTGGYAVRWELPAVQVLLDNTSGGGVAAPTNGGFYVRDVIVIVLIGTTYTGTGGADGLNVDGSCDELSLTGAFFQQGGAVTIVGLEEVWRVPLPQAPIARTCFWRKPNVANRSVMQWGVRRSGYTGALAVGAQYQLDLGSTVSAQVTVSAYAATGPIREMGLFHVDATGVTTVVTTAGIAPVNTGGKLSFIYNSPSNITLLNNMAQTLTIVVDEVWTQ